MAKYKITKISDTGDIQMMYPDEEYEFDGESVTEYPMAQNGKSVKNYITSDLKDYNLRKEAYNDSLSSYKNYNLFVSDLIKDLSKTTSDKEYETKFNNFQTKYPINYKLKTPVPVKNYNGDREAMKKAYKEGELLLYKEFPKEYRWESLSNDKKFKEPEELPVYNPVIPLSEYDRGNIRSKNTVPYKATNDGKQWTPGEYSEYIDSEKIKTAKYNESIRKGIVKQKNGGQSIKLDQLTNFSNYNTKQPGGWLDKYK